MSEEEENSDVQESLEIEVFGPEDTIKILLATDCHLGYERSTKRGWLLILFFASGLLLAYLDIFGNIIYI